MSDTQDVTDVDVNEDAGPTPDSEGSAPEGKTFTQEDVNRMIADRLRREKEKAAEEVRKAQAAKDDESKTELQKLQDQIAALTQENENNKLASLKSRISKDTGVPEELLTGTDEASLTAQAEAIKEFVESKTAKKSTTDNKPGAPLKNGAAPSEMSREDLMKQVMGR